MKRRVRLGYDEEFIFEASASAYFEIRELAYLVYENRRSFMAMREEEHRDYDTRAPRVQEEIPAPP
eukprot:1022849-Prorocentrum_lima.AAC.1